MATRVTLVTQIHGSVLTVLGGFGMRGLFLRLLREETKSVEYVATVAHPRDPGNIVEVVVTNICVARMY